MEILIAPYKGESVWLRKHEGVVLVEKEEDIELICDLLCKQDSDWSEYKHLVKVSPKEITSMDELKQMCNPTGKTCIRDFEEIRKNVNFIVYQYREPVIY